MVLKISLSILLLCFFVFVCLEPYVNRPWYDSTTAKVQALVVIAGFFALTASLASAIWSLLP